MAKYAIAGRRMSCGPGGTDARPKRRYFNPAAPESGRRTNPRRQPFSGGADASDGAAALPAAGSRMNKTPVAEIPMKLRARTAKAREPTASVRAPPKDRPEDQARPEEDQEAPERRPGPGPSSKVAELGRAGGRQGPRTAPEDA